MIMPQALHILCFGDSLTAGFSFWEPKDHPYAISLESTLKAAFPTINVTTDMQGQGGDSKDITLFLPFPILSLINIPSFEIQDT